MPDADRFEKMAAELLPCVNQGCSSGEHWFACQAYARKAVAAALREAAAEARVEAFNETFNEINDWRVQGDWDRDLLNGLEAALRDRAKESR